MRHFRRWGVTLRQSVRGLGSFGVLLMCVACASAQEPKDSMFIDSLPEQPGEERWRFIEDLQAPLWTKHPWESRPVGSGQADLSKGVRIEAKFPDTQERLATAYADLRAFFEAGDVEDQTGPYLITTALDNELQGEAFRIEVTDQGCHIHAGDTEGIRRGIFTVEEQMRQLRGPFLTLGMVRKEPAVLRRISRCFFGPIKRPPKMKDELLDDVNYYPDSYLNRLAHEGVNGLWLTIEFRDLVATRFTPDDDKETAKDAEQRLAKLKRTVDSCLRYGIRTYMFCIEPHRWEKDSLIVKAHPELLGPSGLFCPSSEKAHDFLYESVNTIFQEIPELGGIINITHGERGTTCLSRVLATDPYEGAIDCPRCADKKPGEILYASLTAMEQGMHDAAPDAELISWLYMPYARRRAQFEYCDLADWVYDLPAHTPKGVVMQFNFETGVERQFFGKRMVGGDYWISTPGPSDRFERIATSCREHGTQVSAKIQCGNSHEVATTPFVPVPSLLYRKFAGMHELGVTHTMLCWYFGSYPGLMNQAAGLLSMKPFPKDEQTFLIQLASIDWKMEDVPKVVKAWEHFAQGYENYPLTNVFQYYGPMHDGPVWPLLLKPVDAPLSPTWQIGSYTGERWPPSGDRIGECVGKVLTLEEVVQLAGKITHSWDKGLELLNEIRPNYTEEPLRISDMDVAEALGIQFRSGHNILRFYDFREKMFRLEGTSERLRLLDQLIAIIHDEIKNDERLIELCEKDSRLGFHSEAEAYKYFPEKIRWRMNQLQQVLTQDVPEIRKTILDGAPLFPQYTGHQPTGAVAHGTAVDNPSHTKSTGLHWQTCEVGSKGKAIQWAAQWDSDALSFWFLEEEIPLLKIQLKIEARRLHPAHLLTFNFPNKTIDPRVARVGQGTKDHSIVIRIPWKELAMDSAPVHPIRMDVYVQKKNGQTNSWRPRNPWIHRLRLGNHNPGDLGWLVLDPPIQ